MAKDSRSTAWLMQELAKTIGGTPQCDGAHVNRIDRADGAAGMSNWTAELGGQPSAECQLIFTEAKRDLQLRYRLVT